MKGHTTGGTDVESAVCKVHAAVVVQLINILEPHLCSNLGGSRRAHHGLVLGQHLQRRLVCMVRKGLGK